MAATAMSLAMTVVGGVLKKLGDGAVDEVAKMLGVRQDVWYIIDELEMMQSFLMIAESRRDDNIIIKTWMRQVKDLAYQIEDCLAEFYLHLENRDMFYRLWTLKTRRQVASNIRYIRAKVQEASKRYQRYKFIKPLDLTSNATSKYVNPTTPATALAVEETELVGPSMSKAELIMMLINENSKHRKVIWVTGMGGIGKTTLVKMVYDNHEVISHFPLRAWVVVSQEFNIRELLMNILGHRYDETTPELFQRVKTYLENEAFLVVLDDLWTLQAWNEIKLAFPENNKGSRIIITTRNKNVAEACDYYYQIYPLGPLSDNDSRLLLLKRINKFDDPSFPENKGLADVFKEIIRKCEGLPLAIITIGGLLASKPENKAEWKKLLNHLGSELETNSSTDVIKQILDLSYIVPYHLKPCLLYLGIFPENHVIKRGMLVYRWMAEGFVRERRGMTSEEVAEEYFFELINRSMLQPSEFGLDGRVKSCTVHGITRELIMKNSFDENFIFSSEQENMTLTNNFRHLVVTDSKNFEGNQSSIRSISIFGRYVPNLLLSSGSKSKLLRTLYLEQHSLIEIKDYKQVIQYVQQFKHLKYIHIPYFVRELAKSIQKLRNLQTLVVENPSGGAKRICITKLHKLRHLFVGAEINWCPGGIELDRGIRNLKELQSLKLVDIGRSHPKVVEELAELPQLKKLGVFNLKRKQFKKLSASLSKLRCLRSLIIRIELPMKKAALGFLDGVSSSPPIHLRSIRLSGWIGKLPAWIPSMGNLAKIALLGSKLQEDAIVVLQKLPNLVLLRLWLDSYVGAKLIFEGNTFLKLRVLDVYRLSELNEVVFQEGSLPQLETLEIGACDLKSGINNGKEFLPRLKKITLTYEVYVANLDVVKKQVDQHPNRPALQIKDQKYQDEKKAKY